MSNTIFLCCFDFGLHIPILKQIRLQKSFMLLFTSALYHNVNVRFLSLIIRTLPCINKLIISFYRLSSVAFREECSVSIKPLW